MWVQDAGDQRRCCHSKTLLSLLPTKPFVLLELTAAVLLRKQKMDIYKSPDFKWTFEEIRFFAYQELDEMRVKKLNMMLRPTTDLPQRMETSLPNSLINYLSLY